MTEEQFDVCDEQDQVIGQEARSVVHARNLLHRAVHIWVWKPREEEMYLHLRSPGKDQFPLCLTSSASGHVDAGESYEQAAVRELREELGLTGELRFATKLSASEATAYEHTALYFLTTDDTPIPDPEEIQELLLSSPHQIWQDVQAHPEKFTPPFRELMNWWGNSGSIDQ
ncbi:MAG TPA: NUDIX domain-containing protein [Planctomicrobium sp.]|nr:NUDIX domain-containing protein [Planctomicrobium sp.]